MFTVADAAKSYRLGPDRSTTVERPLDRL